MSWARKDVMGQMSSDPPTLPIMVSAKFLPGLAATSHYFSPIPCPPHGVTPCILDHTLKIIPLCLCLCPKAQNSWSPSSTRPGTTMTLFAGFLQHSHSLSFHVPPW